MDKQCTWVTLIDAMPEYIYGAEDPPAEGEPTDPPKGDPPAEDEDEDDDNSDLDEKDLTGLKSAIKAERAAAKAAIKAQRAAEKALKTKTDAEEAAALEKKSDTEKAEAKAKAATEKAEKLAAGFLTEKLNAAIKGAAGNFIDLTDVLATIDRTKLVYEQDEDDPSQVTVDEKSVKKAVEALATAKPHWIKSGTDDGQPTGSGFGGSKKTDNKTPEEVYKERYPSLR